jgi:Ca-activated chloride channel family protein
MAEEHNGTQEYVTDQEEIEVKIARFFDKLSSPVMTDVRINYVGFRPTEMSILKNLPNLFKGSQFLLTGRYQSSRNSSHPVNRKPRMDRSSTPHRRNKLCMKKIKKTILFLEFGQIAK